MKCGFSIGYGIGRKYWPIWVSVLDLNQNSGFGRTFCIYYFARKIQTPVRDSSLYTSWLNLSIIRSLNLQFPTASTRPINEHIVLDDDNNVNSTSILTSISDRNSRLILQTKRPFNIKVNASCLMLLQARNPFNIQV